MPASRDPSSPPFDPALIPPSVDFGQIVYPPGASFGPRRQVHVQLVLVHRGSAEVTIEGEDRLRIGADEAALLQPGRTELFQFDRDAETHHSWVHLSYGGAAPSLAARLPACLPLSRPLAALMEAALRLPPPTHGLDSLHARMLGAAMLGAYADAAGASAASAAPLPPPLRRAEWHLLEHLAEPLQLADLAAAASVTPSHLVRLYRQHLGTTPMRHLWEARAKRGVDLLRDTGLSVSEVAYRVGCQSPYHFSRLIRRHAGEPPTALRRRLWGQA